MTVQGRPWVRSVIKLTLPVMDGCLFSHTLLGSFPPPVFFHTLVRVLPEHLACRSLSARKLVAHSRRFITGLAARADPLDQHRAIPH